MRLARCKRPRKPRTKRQADLLGRTPNRSPEPPRARGGDKEAGSRRGPSHLSDVGVVGRNADPGVGGASTLSLANGVAQKSSSHASPLGRYAVRLPITPSLKSEIRSLMRTTIRGTGCAPPMRIRGDTPDHRIVEGCRVADGNRSTFPAI